MKSLFLALLFLSSLSHAIEVDSNLFKIVSTGTQSLQCDKWDIDKQKVYLKLDGVVLVNDYDEYRNCLKTSLADTDLKMKIFIDGQELGHWTISSNEVYGSTFEQLEALLKIANITKKKIKIDLDRLMTIPHQYLKSSWKKILSLSEKNNESFEGTATIEADIETVQSYQEGYVRK